MFMKKIKIYVKKAIKNTPIWARISLCLGLFSGIMYLSFLISPEFSDFFNRYPAAFFRALLAKITGVLPFSVAETVIMLLPIIITLVVIRIIKAARGELKETFKLFVSMMAVLSLFFTSFSLMFASGYRGSTLDKKLGLERTPVSAADLDATARVLLNELTELVPQVKFTPSGSSAMPYSLFKMDDKLQDAYIKAAKKYDFLPSFRSTVKPIILSEPMTYTHISGIYTFFTGESNINTNFPDYTLPYTAAHELAHQRGIAREDEANFVAYLVCISSDDAYIRYSGYLNMYEYLLIALRRADVGLYKQSLDSLSRDILDELLAYSAFFSKYEGSVASSISGTINDTYLTIQGAGGSASYGTVVDLTVGYYSD